jgi:NADH:ubiquinone oxidoreductase subunit F (NADH-binding)
VTAMLRGADVAAGALGEPRLLRGIDLAARVDLGLHRQLHGPTRSMSLPELVAYCQRVGLAGRGGAGFAVATKLQALRRGPRAVVVNATESEPASAKDRLLLSRVPHIVLDGAVLVANAIDAKTIYLAVHDEAERDALSLALSERDDRRRFKINVIGGGFVSGEARAVIRALNGGPALPPGRRTLPTESGVGGAATFLSNTETFAQLALLAELGPAAYATTGTREEPGTRLLTVGGAVGRPGVLEVANGVTLDAVLAVSAARPVTAMVIGGYHGSWLTPRPDLRLSRRALVAAGGTLGAGVVLVIDDETCALGELARVAYWLANESARQCGPCTFGLPALAADVAALTQGGRGAEQALKRHASLVAGRGACAHPDGAARFVLSGVAMLRHDIAHHQRHGSCGRPILGRLPVGPRRS